MNLTGDLAILAESDVVPVHSTGSDHDLVVWDLLNPASPRVVQKFSGVVKWLQDERNFVYVLIGERLRVVSEPADSQAKQTESTSSYGSEEWYGQEHKPRQGRRGSEQPPVQILEEA